MQKINAVWYAAVILLNIMIFDSSESQANPYTHFDNDYTQWRISQLFDNKKSLFHSKTGKDYLKFRQKNVVLELSPIVDDNDEYRFRLGPRLLYYLSNKYRGIKVNDSILQDPFYISSYKLDNNLNKYVQKGFSITFSLKPGIKKAEIVDIIPSHEDILPWLCTRETLIKKPACFEEKYETDNKNVSIVVNIKIFPKKIGKHHFKLYVLTKVNDSTYVIVTIPGHFNVSNNNKFQLICYQSMFKISKTSKTYRYLWLKNEDNKMLEITDVVSFGSNLKLSYPLEFELNEFREQHIPPEIKKIVEDTEKRDFWLIPYKSERPILELIFSKYTNEEKYGFEELDWILLQNNIIRIMVDKTEYLYALTAFYSNNYKFWEDDFINLGVFTSRNIYHEVDLYISNKDNNPAIIDNITFTWDNVDFDVYVSSYYKSPIALPFYKNRIKVAKLLVKYKGHNEFSIVRGKIQLQANIYNQIYQESLNFYAVHNKYIFRYKKQKNLNVIDKNEASFDLKFIQYTGSSLPIERFALLRNNNLTRNYSLVSVTSTTFRNREVQKLATLRFEKDDENFKYKEEMIAMLYTLETIISKRIVFYYNTLICSSLSNFLGYRNCNGENLLDFGYLRKKKKSVKKRFIIKNICPLKQQISHITLENTSNLFKYRLQITQFNKKSNQKILLASTDFERTNKLNTDITLSKNSKFYFDVTIKMSEIFQTSENNIKRRSALILHMEDGKTYKIDMEYSFIRGKIKIRPKEILVDMIYPGPLPQYSIYAYSSYPVPLEIEYIERIIDKNNVLSINGFSNLIEPKKRNFIAEFSIDPELLLLQNDNISVPTVKHNSSICLFDINKYHDNNILWTKLKATKTYKINKEIVMKTQLGTKIRIKIKGSIRPPNFLANPLFLGYNILDGINTHNITIKNPYNKPIEVKLFLAPQAFLDVNNIDREIIEQIKIHERNYTDNIICMYNKQLSQDTLRFYAKNLYFDNLEFVNSAGISPNSQSLCFKMPEKTAETEVLYRKLASLSNFFFEFTHYKHKENFLKENTIIINDVERYTYEEPVVVNKPTWKDKMQGVVHQFWNSILFKKKVKKVKYTSTNEDRYFNLNHIKNVTKYIQKKEVHLNYKYVDQLFVIKPRKTLTLKEAVLLRPTTKNNMQNDITQDLFLILKNNATNLYAVPLKYLPVVSKLSAGSERLPNTGRKLIFNVDHIRYFDRESFYEHKMQVRRLIKEDFYFENKGINPIFIKNITIGNATQNEPCLKLLEFRPSNILPQTQPYSSTKRENALKVTFAFHICRRFHTNTTVPVYLHSNEQTYEFQLVITFGKYMIKSVNSKTSKYVISLFLTLFVLINTVAWINLLIKTCKTRKVLILQPKRKVDIFLTDERLKDRIIRYQAEIKLKMYENSPKIVEPQKPVLEKPASLTKKGFKLIPEKDLLNQFDYNNNLYPFIRSNKFNDNSCISEETFEKLFPNASLNISSDHETGQGYQKDDLLANSYIVDEEEVNKNYGTIGDQSVSNFNIIANETFNSKDRKLRKKSDTISHEAFVNSIIIDQKLNKDKEEYEDSLEDMDMMEGTEPISALHDLDFAFGTNIIPKAKRNSNLDNRKRSYTDYTSSVKPEFEYNSPRTSERKIYNPSPIPKPNTKLRK